MLGVQHSPHTTRSASHHASAAKNLSRGKLRTRSNVIESPPDSTTTTPSASPANLPEVKDHETGTASGSDAMDGRDEEGKKESTNERGADDGGQNEEDDAGKGDDDQNNEDQENDTHRGSSPLSELSPAPSNDDDDEPAGNDAVKDNENGDRGAAEAAPGGKSDAMCVLVPFLRIRL